MTKSLHRHGTFETLMERKQRRSGFSAEMQRREEKAQKWRAVADCSRRSSSGDREGAIADGRELSSADNQWWRGRAQSRSAGRQSSSMKYGGANPCRHFYTRTANVKSIRSRTFSLWSWRRTGVTWSNFDDRKISRACCINYRLEPPKMCWDADQGWVAEVQLSTVHSRKAWLLSCCVLCIQHYWRWLFE